MRTVTRVPPASSSKTHSARIVPAMAGSSDTNRTDSRMRRPGSTATNVLVETSVSVVVLPATGWSPRYVRVIVRRPPGRTSNSSTRQAIPSGTSQRANSPGSVKAE